MGAAELRECLDCERAFSKAKHGNAQLRWSDFESLKLEVAECKPKRFADHIR